MPGQNYELSAPSHFVRSIFRAKWGKAGEVVEHMRGMLRRQGGPQAGVQLPSELSGEFDTVVLEVRYESLAQWEHARARMFPTAEFQEDAALEGLIVSGRQEYFTVEVEE